MSASAVEKTSDVIRIDGIYYDTKRVAADHPGGEIFVLIANGQDGTALFHSTHRRDFPHEKWAKYRVPDERVAIDLGPVPTQSFELYDEIVEATRPIIKNGGFAPWHYFVKVAILLGAYLAFEAYFLMHGRTLWLSIVAGVFGAGIGLNIQHDANHGAVSRNGTVNRLLGLGQDLLGGSAIGWMISHDTIHHVHCNDIKRDGDLDMPMLRLKSTVPWQLSHTAQQLYLWVLESFFGVVHVFTTAMMTIEGPKGSQHVLKRYWLTHRIMLLATVVRMAANMWAFPSLHTAAMIGVWYMAGGLYLAFFFVISHNFNGVKKDGVNSQKGCFVRNQVETSSNVAGWTLAQLNGGLNYQIEHHLFPRVHHSFYPHLAPTVRRICEKHGVQYVHFPTLTENVVSVFEHLRSMGTKPQ